MAQSSGTFFQFFCASISICARLSCCAKSQATGHAQLSRQMAVVTSLTGFGIHPTGSPSFDMISAVVWPCVAGFSQESITMDSWI